MAIHIKEENRGKFTKSAKKAGQSVQEHAASVLRPGSGASAKEKKRAVFAKNAKKWAKKRKGR
jgi:sialic acid synthase SpsE